MHRKICDHKYPKQHTSCQQLASWQLTPLYNRTNSHVQQYQNHSNGFTRMKICHIPSATYVETTLSSHKISQRFVYQILRIWYTSLPSTKISIYHILHMCQVTYPIEVPPTNASVASSVPQTKHPHRVSHPINKAPTINKSPRSVNDRW